MNIPVRTNSIYFLFLISLFLYLTPSLHAAPILQSELSPGDNLFNNYGSSTSISGDFLVVGSPGQNGDNGDACIYQRSNQNWNLDSCLFGLSTTSVAVKQYGRSVSISGELAIISANQNPGNRGVAYIYLRQHGAWVQQAELFNPDSVTHNNFGESVSISTNYAVIGNPGRTGQSDGAVYIFKNTDTGWLHDLTLTPDTEYKSRHFGSSVMLFENYLIIGDYQHGSNHEGAAYIYKHEDDLWKLQASLKGGQVTRNSNYGSSVSISNHYAVVGAKLENDPNIQQNKKMGAAYVYKREGKLWHHQAKLIADDTTKGDRFASSVSISGEYIIIGADNDNSAAGSSYLFRHLNGSWTEQHQLQAEDNNAGDLFGSAVSISDNYLAIGASNKNTGSAVTGAIYVYELNIAPATTDTEFNSLLQSLDDPSVTTDSDGDGLSDNDEIILLGTNPDSTDTDNDGLTDQEEVALYQSNPLVADSDSDGITDFQEVVIYNSDPLLTDSDGDGFTDSYEINTLNTDPSLVDSDSDGITDQQEISTTLTSPSLADTDGDGLTDNEELNIFNTNPYQPDSDGDGVTDGNEVTYYETDPADQNSSPATPSISTSFTPADGQQGTMAFEDEWPLKGDYDFNDAVINYNVEEAKLDGLVKQTIIKYLPVARGAIYDNSLKLLINTPISNITSASIKSRGVTTPLTATADGNKTLFRIIDSIKDALPPPPGFKLTNTLSGSPKMNGTLYTVTINFNSPVNPSILGAPPYNTFISRLLENDELIEVHFPGYFPSTKASKRKFGKFNDDFDKTQDRYYQTADNLPWAMLVPSVWHHTKERVDLANGYPDILLWASSKGKKSKNWHKSKRHGIYIFEQVPDL